MRRMVKLIFLVLPLFMLMVMSGFSCRHETAPTPKQGFYSEEYKLLIPDLHGFERLSNKNADWKEMVLLRRGGSWIWFGKLGGILVGDNADSKLSEIWGLAQQRVYDASYLKGTRLSPGKMERVKHPTRPYIDQILIVQRTQALMDLFTNMDRQIYASELERIPVGRRMILANYYTPVGDSIYIMSILAPAADFFFQQDESTTMFQELQFDVAGRPAGY